MKFNLKVCVFWIVDFHIKYTNFESITNPCIMQDYSEIFDFILNLTVRMSKRTNWDLPLQARKRTKILQNSVRDVLSRDSNCY